MVLEPMPSHHLTHVLRSKPGSTVLLFNGDGFEYHAVYASNEGKLARVQICDVTQPQRESRLHIHIGQGISRGERMDWVVQKSVELGVQTITPLWTQRSQVQLQGKRLDKRLSHWEGIIISACEQSGRVHLPSLHPANSLKKWTTVHNENETCLILDPTADQVLNDIEPMQQARVLIGPEGGFEDSEIEQAVESGFCRIKLGPRVLRTETAAL
ncbi:16S rRNA (uracil(1498)-N(3))-methyltransferase, partial [hydrothermal vent metagenome]